MGKLRFLRRDMCTVTLHCYCMRKGKGDFTCPLLHGANPPPPPTSFMLTSLTCTTATSIQASLLNLGTLPYHLPSKSLATTKQEA